MNTHLTKPNHASSDRIGFAIIVLLLGIVTVTTGDLISKAIIPLISIWQLLALRSLLGLMFLLSVLLFSKKLHSVTSLNLKAVLLRSSLMTACYLCFYLALAKIPIALVAGAFFCGPFFMVILSRILLGETFGLWRASSLIGGFIGVILVLQPTSIEFNSTMLLPLLSAFLYALTQVVTRKYCKKEDPIALSCWLTVTFLATGLFGMIILWLLPDISGTNFIDRPSAMLSSSTFFTLCLLGVFSIIVHYSLSAAYQNAPASLLGPLEYVYLPLALVGGYIFFDESPNLTALIGISIITVAGLIVAWHKDA